MSQVFALFSAMLYGVGDFAGGLSSRTIDPWRVTAWAQVLGVPLLVVGLLVLPADEVGRADLLYGALAGILGVIGLVALYGALAAGTMSIVSPIAGTLTALIPVMWGLATGEEIAAYQWLGIGLAVGAVVLVTRGHDRGHLTLAVGGRAVIASIAFAAFFIALDQTSESAGLWPLAAGRAVSVPFALIIALILGNARIPGRSDLPLVALAGNADVAANMSILVALQTGPLGINTVLTSLYPAFTALAAVIFLHERPTIAQRTGILLALLAAIVLVL